MHNFKKLDVWQKSRTFVKALYKVTKDFPKEEIYCLTNQIRRATISIPSNIAEGAGRTSKKEFHRFLEIAHSSAFEVETQLLLAFDLEYINKSDFEIISSNLTEIQKMLYGLMKNVS